MWNFDRLGGVTGSGVKHVITRCTLIYGKASPRLLTTNIYSLIHHVFSRLFLIV